MDTMQSLIDLQVLVVLVVLFFIFLGVSLFFLSTGQPRALLRGLVGTLMDLLAAPFVYLRYAAFRLVQEGGQSTRLNVSDPQFLMRTALRIQLASLFVVLSIFSAVGLVMVLHLSVSPEVVERRREASRALEELRNTLIPGIEIEIQELEAKLSKAEAAQKEIQAKKAEVAQMEARLGSLQRELLGGESSEHFDAIERFLRENQWRIRQELFRLSLKWSPSVFR